jgi:hypothetical protein
MEVFLPPASGFLGDQCYRRNKTAALSPVLRLKMNPLARTRYILYMSF